MRFVCCARDPRASVFCRHGRVAGRLRRLREGLLRRRVVRWWQFPDRRRRSVRGGQLLDRFAWGSRLVCSGFCVATRS